MRLLYFLVAQDVIVDERSNQVSLVKIVTRRRIAESNPEEGGVAWAGRPLVAVAELHEDEDDFVSDPESEGEVVTPSVRPGIVTPRREIPAQDFPVQFGGGAARCYIDLPGLPNDGTGVYVLRLTYLSGGEERTAEWMIDARTDSSVGTYAPSAE